MLISVFLFLFLFFKFHQFLSEDTFSQNATGLKDNYLIFSLLSQLISVDRWCRLFA